MKTLIITLTLTALLTACGAGAPSNTAPNTTVTVKTYPCDASIVAIMSTMPTPNLLGLGEPDTTTYSTTGQNHILKYDFVLAKMTIEFEYNTVYCRETVTQR